MLRVRKASGLRAQGRAIRWWTRGEKNDVVLVAPKRIPSLGGEDRGGILILASARSHWWAMSKEQKTAVVVRQPKGSEVSREEKKFLPTTFSSDWMSTEPRFELAGEIEPATRRIMHSRLEGVRVLSGNQTLQTKKKRKERDQLVGTDFHGEQKLTHKKSIRINGRRGVW